MNDSRNVPAQKCPNLDCRTLHRFNDTDIGNTKGARHFGPGAVIVCAGCAQVNMVANNLSLNPVEDPAFIASDPVRQERWRVVAANPDLDPPQDLVEAEAEATGAEVIVLKDPDHHVGTMAVWPTVGSPVDYGYVLSVTTRPGVELIATGVDPGAAELIFRVIDSARDDIGAAQVEPGQPFTLDTDFNYEYVLAPIPDQLAEQLGLPDRETVTYLQVVWQDQFGWWPWDEQGDGSPIMAGPDWRPDRGDQFPVVVDFTGKVNGAVKEPIEVTEAG